MYDCDKETCNPGPKLCSHTYIVTRKLPATINVVEKDGEEPLAFRINDDGMSTQRGKMRGQRWFCIFRGLYGHMGCHWKGLDQAKPDLSLLIIFATQGCRKIGKTTLKMCF